MNVYDSARTLANSIKSSEEWTQYENMKKTIEGNDKVIEMINDFHEKQIALQTKQMMGQEMDAESTAQLQQLYAILMTDPLAAQYIQAEMRFSLMMNDIYKILGEVINLGGLVK